MTQDVLARLQATLHDRYRTERPIGAGGVATVYLAEDRRHSRHLAIKVLHPKTPRRSALSASSVRSIQPPA